MKEITLSELVETPGFIGGDIMSVLGKHYAGNITRVRDYGRRATFHFTWAAAKTERGWTKRNELKTTLYYGPITPSEDGKSFSMHGIVFYLKGHGVVKQEEVLEKFTHRDRKRAAEDKKKNDEPKFI